MPALAPVEAIVAAASPVMLVVAALLNSAYRSLHRLTCVVEDGELVLRGTLNSFYLKQIAQQVALKAAGWHRLRNEIEVLST